MHRALYFMIMRRGYWAFDQADDMSHSELGHAAGKWRQPYYGWVILLVVFVTQMLAIGGTSYSFGIFVKPATEEFDVSRSTINHLLILWMAGMTLSGPLVGSLLDRYAPRHIVGCGALMFGFGLITVSMSQNPLFIVLAVLLLIGPGSAALGPLMAATLVSRWFDHHRGRALGIASIAPSIGGFAIVPALALSLELFGWRAALFQMGAVAVVLLLPLSLLLVRSDASAAPDAVSDGTLAEGDEGSGWTFVQLLKTREFWLVALGVGLLFSTGQAMLASLVPYGTDIGFDPLNATLLVSVLAIANICGKLSFGVLSDRVEKRRLFCLAALLGAVCFTLLTMRLPYAAVLVAVFIGGLGIGGVLPIWGGMLADTFGRRSYGVVMGAMGPIHLPLNLAAIAGIGAISDHTGSYGSAFLLFAVLAVLGGVLVFQVRSRNGQSLVAD